MVQVYAVLYLEKKGKLGPFLMARKRDTGYFFSGNEGGALVPKGQPLKNPEGYTLPGGRREEDDNNIIAAAAREYKEETGDGIPTESFAQLPAMKAWNGFAAAYFPVPSLTGFNAIIKGINEKNLPQARRAAQNVRDGEITDYTAIEEMHKDGCPLSDELAAVEAWNMTNKANWETIVRWKEDQFVNGWTYRILLYLKTTILQLDKDYIS